MNIFKKKPDENIVDINETDLKTLMSFCEEKLSRIQEDKAQEVAVLGEKYKADRLLINHKYQQQSDHYLQLISKLKKEKTEEANYETENITRRGRPKIADRESTAPPDEI